MCRFEGDVEIEEVGGLECKDGGLFVGVRLAILWNCGSEVGVEYFLEAVRFCRFDWRLGVARGGRRVHVIRRVIGERNGSGELVLFK
jgi:hypothetical protein